LERACKDEEEVVVMQKERDELLQRDVEGHQRILDLLGKVEERNLKLAVEGKLAASETRTHQDVMMIEQLHKEQDGLL
jgi:hypothetical protein